MILERVVELRRRRRSSNASPSPPQPDTDFERRLEALETRVAHLESALEGLQDATYRQATTQDKRIDELQKRTAPDQIARALTDDARKRGL